MSQANSYLEFRILNCRLGFGVLGFWSLDVFRGQIHLRTLDIKKTSMSMLRTQVSQKTQGPNIMLDKRLQACTPQDYNGMLCSECA